MKKKNNIKTRKLNSGFTLVELLAVIAILSLVVSITIYASSGVIDNAKKKSYATTINNVKTVTSNYLLENPDLTDWVKQENGCKGESSDCQYQCITIKNLISMGYFSADILDSEIDKEEHIKDSDLVYVERDYETKTITYKKFPVTESDNLCEGVSSTGSILFNVSSSGWKSEKTVTITYTLNSAYELSDNIEYSYSYAGKKVQKFTKRKEIVNLTLTSGACIEAQIGADKSKTFCVTTVDGEGPTVTMTMSSNKFTNNRKVDITLDDGSGSGIKGYYFGRVKPDELDANVRYETTANVKSIKLTKEIDGPGTWYLQAVDAAGNYSDVESITVYSTQLKLENNATVIPGRLIDISDAYYNLSELPVKVDEYYTFNGWYTDPEYNNRVNTTIIGQYCNKNSYSGESCNKVLYGKVTENKFIEPTITINGTLKYNSELNVTLNNIKLTNPENPGNITYTYEWYSSSGQLLSKTENSLLTTNTYKIGSGLVGKSIYVVVKMNKENYRTGTFKSTQTSKVQKADGYIVLNKSSGSMTYGENVNITLTVTKHHGGSLKVTDNSDTVTTSISSAATKSGKNSVITLNNLSKASAGVIVVTVTSGATLDYAEAKATYTLTVNKANNPIAVTGKTLTYTGNAQQLVTTTNAQGIVYYSTTTELTSSNYTSGSTTIPSGTNSGVYNIYWYTPGNDNYNAKSGSVTTKIKSPNPIVVTANTLTYNKNTQRLVTVKNAEGTVYYSTDVKLDSSNFMYRGSTSIPTKTDAGTYMVYWYVIGNDNYDPKSGSEKVIINKANGYVNLSTKSGSMSYGGTASMTVKVTGSHGGSLSIKTSNNNIITNVGGTSFYLSNLNKLNAGSYTATISSAATNNYTEASATYTLTVNKANNPIVVLGKTGLSNTGKAQQLATTTNAQGTVYYSTSTPLTSSNYKSGSTTIPSKTDGGTYTIYWYVTGNSNYNSASGSVTASIKYLNPVLIKATTGLKYTGSAQKLVTTTNAKTTVYYSTDVKLDSSNFMYRGSTSIPTKTNAGTYTVYWYATSNDSYDPKSGSVSVTIGKANGYITLSSTSGSMTYGRTASITVVVSSSHGGSFSIKTSSSTITTNIGGTSVYLSNLNKLNAGSYTATISSAETGNYTSASATYTFTVNKANNPIVVLGKTGLSNTGNAQQLVTTTNAQGTVYYSTSTSLTSSNYTSGSTTVPSKKDGGTYTVYWYVTGNSNYNSASGSVTASIKYLNLVLIKAKTGLKYTGSAQSLVTVSGAQGTVYYSTDVKLDSSNFMYRGSTTIPTKTNAGTYTVYWYVTGNDSYDPKSGSVSVTIGKANGYVNLSATSGSTTYGSTSSKTVTVSSSHGGTLSIKTSSSTITTNNGGTSYYLSNLNKLNAGSYTVTITSAATGNHTAASATYTLTVGKANNPVVVSGRTGLSNTGSAQSLVTVSGAQGTVYYSTSTSLTSSNYTSGSTTIPSKKDGGTYTVYWYVTGNSNYNSASGSVTASIKYLNLVLIKAKTGLKYTGSTQSLVTVSGAQGTVYYSTDVKLDSSNFMYRGSTTIPTKTNAGTYTVYWYVTGNDSYDPKSGSVSVTIGKANGYVNLSATSGSTTYGSTSSKTVTVSSSHGGTLSIKTSSSTITTNNGGTSYYLSNLNKLNAGSYTVTITSAATGNHTAASATYTLTVSKANNPIVVSGRTGLTYTGSAQNLVTVSGAQGTVYYSTSTSLTSSNYTSGSTTIPSKKDGGTYTVYWYTPGNSNYNSASGSVTSIIKQKNPAVVAAKTGLKYNGSAQQLVTTSNAKTTVVYSTDVKLDSSNFMSRGSTTIPTKTNAGTYTVYWYAYSDSSYEASSGSVSVTIGKATGYVTLSNTTDTARYGTETKIFTVKTASGSLSVTDNNDTAVLYTSSENTTGILLVGLANLSNISPTTITVTVTSAANTNYTAASATYTLTITKLDNPIVVTGRTGLSNTGSSQNLVTVSNAQGTVWYSTTELTSSNYTSGSTTIPTASSGGSYTVHWYTPGNAYYNSKSGSVKASINMANPVVVSARTGLTYNGSAQNLVTVSNAKTTVYYSTDISLGISNFMSRGSTTIPSKKDGGTYTVYWYAIESSGYSAKSGSVSVTIAKKTGNITLSKTSDSITATSKSSLSFTVTKHHGGTLTVSDNNGTASTSISGNTVTVSNLSSISSGTITVTVTSGSTGEFNSASAKYILTICSASCPKVTGLFGVTLGSVSLSGGQCVWTATGLEMDVALPQFAIDKGYSCGPSTVVWENCNPGNNFGCVRSVSWTCRRAPDVSCN